MKIFRKVNFKNVLVNNLWLKLMALATAIIVWMYVSGEITKGVRI